MGGTRRAPRCRGDHPALPYPVDRRLWRCAHSGTQHLLLKSARRTDPGLRRFHVFMPGAWDLGMGIFYYGCSWLLFFPLLLTRGEAGKTRTNGGYPRVADARARLNDAGNVKRQKKSGNAGVSPGLKGGNTAQSRWHICGILAYRNNRLVAPGTLIDWPDGTSWQSSRVYLW